MKTKKYTLLPNVGVYDKRTKKRYNALNITDEVCEYLLSQNMYTDRIVELDFFYSVENLTISKMRGLRSELEDSRKKQCEKIEVEQVEVEIEDKTEKKEVKAVKTKKTKKNNE